jgi:Flp pilus assembly protein TadG
MKQLLARFWRDQRGVGALEFALLTPALVLIIAGIGQIGILFMANAGLRHAVAEGARFATIWPRPSDTDITNFITSSRFGLDPDNVEAPDIDHGEVDGTNYVDITVTYTVDLNFVFFTIEDLELTQSRRAFIHPA